MATKPTARRLVPWLEDPKRIDVLRSLFPPRRVLITGGTARQGGAPGQLHASAEIYDPASGQFVPTGAMIAARASHVAVALGQERVIVSGGLSAAGNSSRYTDSAEIYAGGTFRAVSSMVVSRAGHQATVLYGGTVLMAGGVGTDPAEPMDPTLSSAEYLNPLCASEFRYEFVRTAGAMMDNRNRHTLTALKRRPLALVAGGYPGSGELALRAAEIYDHQSRTFLPLEGTMVEPRVAHAAVLLRDGRVLLAGGSTRNGGAGLQRSAELFDPATMSFTATGSMASARDRATATLLPDGRVLIAGGFGSNGAILRSAEIYDPATGRFNSAGNMRAERAYHTATPLGDGRILIAGGLVANGDGLSSAEIFNPDSGNFSFTGSMSVGRLHHAATAL